MGVRGVGERCLLGPETEILELINGCLIEGQGQRR